MFASSARMCTASTQATACFLPCARRKSGILISSACSERIVPGSRGARPGPAGGATSGGSGCGLESSARASGPAAPRRSPSACRGDRCSARWRGRSPSSGPASASPPHCTSCRTVHRAGKPGRVAERLRQEHPVPVRRQPVVGEPAGHPRKEEGGEVREHPRLGQDQETRVVRHHLQPPELLLRLPAAPPVAGRALEGAVLPRRQAQPPVPEACHVAQAAGRQPLEAEIVALVHQRVPERALLRPGQPDLDVRQGKPRRHPAKRGMELEALANRHGRSIARPGRERQRKIPAPRSRAHATQTSPVSRKTSRNQRGMPLPLRNGRKGKIVISSQPGVQESAENERPSCEKA